MNGAEAQRIEQAVRAVGGEVKVLIFDPSPQVIGALLRNPALTEADVLIIANRKDLPGGILEAVMQRKDWAESYPVRLAVARNPKTPLFTSLTIARTLRLFDLAELARSPVLPVVFRKKLEALISEKIPALPLGVKKTLAKIAAGDVLLSLLLDGYPEVVSMCLDNPRLTDSHLFKVIGRKTVRPGTIRTIAGNQAWTSRYHIKFALVRNEHTPLPNIVAFLRAMKLLDLRELYQDPLLPSQVKPCIHRELIERGHDPALYLVREERVYEIDEEELEALEREPTVSSVEGEQEHDQGAAERPDEED